MDGDFKKDRSRAVETEVPEPGSSSEQETVDLVAGSEEKPEGRGL